jgi:hypothetical protein
MHGCRRARRDGRKWRARCRRRRPCRGGCAGSGRAAEHRQRCPGRPLPGGRRHRRHCAGRRGGRWSGRRHLRRRGGRRVGQRAAAPADEIDQRLHGWLGSRRNYGRLHAIRERRRFGGARDGREHAHQPGMNGRRDLGHGVIAGLVRPSCQAPADQRHGQAGRQRHDNPIDPAHRMPTSHSGAPFHRALRSARCERIPLIRAAWILAVGHRLRARHTTTQWQRPTSSAATRSTTRGAEAGAASMRGQRQPPPADRDGARAGWLARQQEVYERL